MSHILEQYFSGTDDNTSDYLMEGLLRSLIHSSRIAVQSPEDYEAKQYYVDRYMGLEYPGS